MKVRTRWYDRVMTGLSLGALLAVTLYVLLAWKTLPEHPPSHFDFRGAADAWGNNKTTILTPLALAWFLFGLVTFTEHMPSTWNTAPGYTPSSMSSLPSSSYWKATRSAVYFLPSTVIVTLPVASSGSVTVIFSSAPT